MKKTTAPKRKTGRMIAKNLIILLVVAIVAALAIWAWFSKHTSATADGINVQAQGGGVEVSWTGEENTYYENLTALTTADVTDTNGLAKEIDDEYSTLKLITGNGNLFFIPTLNRRTGAVVTNTNGTWCGSSFKANDNNSIAGKYIDIPLYFRSTASKDVYLSSDSIVAPCDDSDTRMSSYGDFSTDYICSAARVAFIEKTDNTEEVKYIWAPNSNYELVENDAGYQLVDDTNKDSYSTTTSGGGDLDNFLIDKQSADSYYLWLPENYNEDSMTMSTLSYVSGNDLVWTEYGDEGKGLYTCTFNLTGVNRTADLPVVVNLDNTKISSTDVDYGNSYLNINDTSANNPDDTETPLITVSTQSYNIDVDTDGDGSTESHQTAKLYLSGITTNAIDITLGYDPVNKRLIVISYTVYDANDSTTAIKEIDRVGTTTTTIDYYELSDTTTYVALGNISTKTAVTTDSTYSSNLKNVTFNGTTISNNSITTYEQFRIVKEGDGYSATYTLQNTKDSSYVVLSDATVSFTNTASDATAFSLRAYDGVTGPVLVSGSYCLGVVNAKLTGITTASLTASPSQAVTIFRGAGYKMLLTSSSSQTYQFYNWETNKLETLYRGSDPPLYDTTAYETGETVTKVGTSLLTLTKDSDSDYYTGQITMRIWVEGTDRDALAPLAGGKFKLNLHFTS